MKKLIDTSKINDPVPHKKRSKPKVADGHANDKPDNYRADHRTIPPIGDTKRLPKSNSK